MDKVTRFIRDEEGIATIEYAILAALIGTVIIVGAQQFGIEVNRVLGITTTAVTGL